jgi:AMP nucleosidase
MDTLKITKEAGDDAHTLRAKVESALNRMAAIYTSGYYAKLVVMRSWSVHNPSIDGEFAEPEAYRWFLRRELLKLLDQGAEIQVECSRARLALNDPALLDAIDEDLWDPTQKKLFLFRPERIELSVDRLKHYTGTPATAFQRYVLFTNYEMHVEVFLKKYPNCVRPDRSVQMPAYHHVLDNNLGVTLVNIGVGPSNAKTCSDHIAVLRPDAMIMVGHCGGLRNQQEIGDFVLASGYFRADNILDSYVPLNVPITPTHILNEFLLDALEHFEMKYRVGTVYTTANRNWEFSKTRTVSEFNVSRSVAIDMESATLATNGFRYRVPHATLLCVSDKPLHGRPKLSGAAQHFYQNSKEKHLEIVLHAIERCRSQYPHGLPTSMIRATDEPLMGGV